MSNLTQSLNIRALYHKVVRHDQRIRKLEERMAALPSDAAVTAKFAPVLEHLRALGAPANPVPAPPAGLTLPDAPAAA